MNNWKTSAAGVCGGIPQIVSGVSSKDWTQVITGVFTVLIGLFAKDHDVTGGIKLQ